MTKPAHLDPLAEKILARLAGRPEVSEIVLGGYFALQHYLDYRRTHDIDAWWKTRANHSTELAIEEAMCSVATEEALEFQKRTFGDTLSFEMLRANRRVFSFQIAVRSVELASPVDSPWPPMLIETLADNVGAKMNALADRGSPRDFLDIRRVVEAGLVSILRCWELWQGKNPGSPCDAAKDKVRLHLAALEARRPLDSITDAAERNQARATRDWFRTEFLR